MFSHHVCDLDGLVLRAAVEQLPQGVKFYRANVLLVELKGLLQLVRFVAVLKQLDAS